jgi:hypothetical protein
VVERLSFILYWKYLGYNSQSVGRHSDLIFVISFSGPSTFWNITYKIGPDHFIRIPPRTPNFPFRHYSTRGPDKASLNYEMNNKIWSRKVPRSVHDEIYIVRSFSVFTIRRYCLALNCLRHIVNRNRGLQSLDAPNVTMNYNVIYIHCSQVWLRNNN